MSNLIVAGRLVSDYTYVSNKGHGLLVNELYTEISK